MGPRLFRRGNSVYALNQYTVEMVLQWGHVFSDVETTAQNGDSTRRQTASMGPRLFRRGNSTNAAFVSLAPKASMGPRLFRRGNTASDMPTLGNCNLLQWGHVFSDVETLRYDCLESQQKTLQWGHVFSDVETCTISSVMMMLMRLQWGHVFSDVETRR